MKKPGRHRTAANVFEALRVPNAEDHLGGAKSSSGSIPKDYERKQVDDAELFGGKQPASPGCCAESCTPQELTPRVPERNHQGLGNELIEARGYSEVVGPVRRRQRLGGVLNNAR